MYVFTTMLCIVGIYYNGSLQFFVTCRNGPGVVVLYILNITASVVLYGVVWFYVVLSSKVLYCLVLSCAVWCCVVLCGVVLYGVVWSYVALRDLYKTLNGPVVKTTTTQLQALIKQR